MDVSNDRKASATGDDEPRTRGRRGRRRWRQGREARPAAGPAGGPTERPGSPSANPPETPLETGEAGHESAPGQRLTPVAEPAGTASTVAPPLVGPVAAAGAGGDGAGRAREAETTAGAPGVETTAGPAAAGTGASAALPDAASLVAAEYPWRSVALIAKFRAERYQTVIRRAVLNDIHRHGSGTTEVEVCGVLVGNVYRDAFGAYLYVDAGIRGDSASSHATQVTFRAETWAQIQETMDRDFPDRKIVGWYHTHPGFGIFLSGMDLFIQDNFFNLAWQVAFVYDPVGGDEGAFLWRGGKPEREPFLIDESITADEARRSAWEWKKPAATARPRRAARIGRFARRWWLRAAAAGVIGAAGAGLWWLTGAR